MTVKAKRFRIGVEGATTDGREIQREWLEQMAASYNPAVYTALINIEHIKSYLPVLLQHIEQMHRVSGHLDVVEVKYPRQ
ncbi:GPO family capsid scaffolding protein, partial [Klebsiella pneumoniae]